MSTLQNLLNKSGISAVSNGSSRNVKEEKSLEAKLDRAGLGLENVLGELATILQDSENESTKLKALEHVLKMHGVMKDSGAAPASVNIIINDGAYGNGDRNPILFPREISLELSPSFGD